MRCFVNKRFILRQDECPWSHIDGSQSHGDIGWSSARGPRAERRLSEQATAFQHSETARNPQLFARGDGRQPSSCYEEIVWYAHLLCAQPTCDVAHGRSRWPTRCCCHWAGARCSTWPLHRVNSPIDGYDKDGLYLICTAICYIAMVNMDDVMAISTWVEACGAWADACSSDGCRPSWCLALPRRERAIVEFS